MLPIHHAMAAAALWPAAARYWSPKGAAWFVAASVLIDADHYASFVLSTGDWSLHRAYHWHRRHTLGRRFGFRRRWPRLGMQPERPLHAPLVILSLLLLARWWPPLAPVAWGALLHRVLDYVDEYAFVKHD